MYMKMNKIIVLLRLSVTCFVDISKCRLMTRVKLRAMTIEAATKMRKALTDKMREFAHIATTTDCWTVRRRGFIGVTAHWINEDLNRWAFLSSHVL